MLLYHRDWIWIQVCLVLSFAHRIAPFGRSKFPTKSHRGWLSCNWKRDTNSNTFYFIKGIMKVLSCVLHHTNTQNSKIINQQVNVNISSKKVEVVPLHVDTTFKCNSLFSETILVELRKWSCNYHYLLFKFFYLIKPLNKSN